MTVLSRARNIIINPRVTWQVIKDETVEVKQLFINYAAPLALIPAICSLIGMTLFGVRMPSGLVVRAPFMEALTAGALGYVFHLVAVFIGGHIIKLLAPVFKSKVDLAASIKLAVFSMTPAWLAGVFSLIPGLGLLSILGLYGIYLFVLGLPVLLDTPPNKVVFYVLSVLVASFVISLVLSLILVGTVYGPMYMRMMAA
ncbi:Yip1 family protein [Candidatus Margulisiibacteriota bacterium]